MGDKKNAGRFCVQFNLNDPRHRQVIELLEQQGRRKAQFIVEAVLRDGDAPAGPDMAQLKRQVEAWVRELLSQQTVIDNVAPDGTDAELKAAIQGVMAGWAST